MRFDFILKGGFIIDGATKNSKPERADIALEGDRIKKIGLLANSSAKKVINIDNMYVCPGFIDVHAHSEFVLIADGRAAGKICQGITTEVNGNCGLSAAPLYGPALEQREKDLDEFNIKERWGSFPEYFALLEKKGIALNFATLVGHGNLRASVLGYADRPLSKAEKKKVYKLMENAIQSGARGVSTGLIYPPGIYSDTSELIELSSELKKYEGIYSTHMRSEGDRLLESVDEVISIAEESKIHAHISHLKTSGERNWSKLPEVFQKIELANRSGLDLTCDRYPYIASSTDLDSILPSWAFEGGRSKELERLKNERARLSGEILRLNPEVSFWDKVVISSVGLNKNKWMEGKSLLHIGRTLKNHPVQCFFDTLIDEELQVGAVFFTMDEKNLKSVLKYRCTMLGTDSSARSFDGITANGMPHPRGFGSFPRVLGRYARDQGILEIGEAVYKMTGLPARTFRLNRRGVIAKEYFADITVFNAEEVNDCAEFSDPFRQPEGIYHVFVNGEPVILDQEFTGVLPGRVLK